MSSSTLSSSLPSQPSDSPTPSKRPSQITFYRPAQMALFANITTFPPLSQVSVIPPSRREFNFTVVLEVSTSIPEVPWEVSIWYDHAAYCGGKSQWQALDLKRTQDGPYDLDRDRSTTKNHRYTFTGNLQSPFSSTEKVYKGRRVPFTVRYRINADHEWQWVYHNHGIADGELILQPPLDPNFLGASPVDLQPGWTARKLTSESPDAKLYSMDSTDTIPPAAEGKDAQPQRKMLGRVLQCMRWFALVRIWSPWLAPRHGHHKFLLTEPALLVSFLRSDGMQVVLLAVNGVDDVLTTFASSDDGQIVIEARNDSTEPKRFRCLAAAAWTFEVALSAVIYELRKVVRSSAAYQQYTSQLPKEIEVTAESVESESDTVLVSTIEEGSQDGSPPSPAWLESWYDSLAYCTWNSLGQDLTQDKILKALDSLSRNKINISTLIIDDNWQSLSGKQGETQQSSRGWSDFEANPSGFPDGLAAATKAIRDKYPHVRDIAVWHALFGYWGGIDPDGKIAKTYNTRRCEIGNGNTQLTVDPSSIHQMYQDFYKFLSSAGITSVKTDVQFMLDELRSTADRDDYPHPYLSAWTTAHLTHLSGKAISCMSCTPQILFYLFLPTTTPRVLLRNSDDFFPDISESHPWHIFCNAHVALLTQHLNVLPDWDMFQTSHSYSGFHAAARCLSGGPIYITDYPDQHDVDLINSMTARSMRGETVILRPSTIGKTVGVYDKYDDRGVLKLGVYHGAAQTGVGMLGVFNIAEQDMKAVLPITKIPGVDVVDESAKVATPGVTPNSSRPVSRRGSRRGSNEVEEGMQKMTLEEGEEEEEVERRWIVRSYQSGRVTGVIVPEAPLTAGMMLSCTLPVRGWDVWSAFPVKAVEVDDEEVQVAVLGLVAKITGAAAVLGWEIIAVEEGKRVKCSVRLKAMGVLGIWIAGGDREEKEEGRERWQKENMMVMIQNRAVPINMVQVVSEGVEGDGRVIEVDVLGAWNEMGLDAGWSNELSVDVFFK